ncbi:MAG: hypothetical protein UH963_11765 [Agathobacter sp.]|nr:hypothetical protein [Agathobacter sp.]
MKKIMANGLVLALCLGLMSGCGKNYEAKQNTVFILDDGKIVSTSVEKFDKDTYSEDEFKDYVKDQIEDYTDKNGKNSVKMKSLKVEDGNATLTLEYDNALDYSSFDGEELFAGTMAEALANKYDFAEKFAKIDGDNVSECSKDDFINEDGLKVVVIKGNVNVKVDGTIVYASAVNTKLVDENTIAICDGENLLGQEEQEGTESVVTEESSQSEMADTSVSEDELLELDTEAQQEVVFNFNDDNETALKQTYTYIIYK